MLVVAFLTFLSSQCHWMTFTSLHHLRVERQTSLVVYTASSSVVHHKLPFYHFLNLNSCQENSALILYPVDQCFPTMSRSHLPCPWFPQCSLSHLALSSFKSRRQMRPVLQQVQILISYAVVCLVRSLDFHPGCLKRMMNGSESMVQDSVSMMIHSDVLLSGTL